MFLGKLNGGKTTQVMRYVSPTTKAAEASAKNVKVISSEYFDSPMPTKKFYNYKETTI